MMKKGRRFDAIRSIEENPAQAARSGNVSRFAIGLLVPGCILLTGCTVATLPFRATSKVVDWSTTSQEERDRNRGRDLRHQEEQARRDDARCARNAADC
jgi:hypothetical protein